MESFQHEDNTVLLLQDLETINLPRTDAITSGLAKFRAARLSGVLRILDAPHGTVWIYELCGGEVTQTAALMGVSVPAEAHTLDGSVARFDRDAILTL